MLPPPVLPDTSAGPAWSGGMTNAMYATDTASGHREFGRIYPPDEAWLARQPEEPVLEPDLPIVDSHFHLIDQPGFRYLAGELAADIDSGHRVEATVYVEMPRHYRPSGPEALRPVGETERTARETAGTPRLATGIVGYADLALGSAVEDVLLQHQAAAGARFKGVRYATPRDPNPSITVHHQVPAGTTETAAFHAGADVLERLGLSLDAYVFFHQLDEVTALARAHPSLPVVVGHCGGLLGYGPYAGRHGDVFAEWRRKLAGLARCPNVSVKLGGVLMRLATHDYLNIDAPETSARLADCLRPCIVPSIELFGAERCMFESNFPVDKIATGYRVLWNAFKRITAEATLSEKVALFSGTARRVYRLA